MYGAPQLLVDPTCFIHNYALILCASDGLLLLLNGIGIPIPSWQRNDVFYVVRIAPYQKADVLLELECRVKAGERWIMIGWEEGQVAGAADGSSHFVGSEVGGDQQLGQPIVPS